MAVLYTVGKAAVAVEYLSESTGTRVAVQGPLSAVPWVCHRRAVPLAWPDKVTEPGTVDFDHVAVLRPLPRPKELLDRKLAVDCPRPKSFAAVAAAVEVAVEPAVVELAAVGAVVALNMDLVRPIALVNVQYHLYIIHMELTYVLCLTHISVATKCNLEICSTLTVVEL